MILKMTFNGVNLSLNFIAQITKVILKNGKFDHNNCHYEFDIKNVKLNTKPYETIWNVWNHTTHISPSKYEK
ncbi:hypothetical protein GLOIN_2v1557474 [Rhizophagus irregularis DAOM 181602=DAOM 197198]|uniref:Uncharacterized protein n=2 Tax=Rhizophagus irregularis (strain DAOM 181602 / DAOM 197198 / MUCL 43194) TaxID=747089 RepID=A0A2P4QFI2_RHIID|nr:hypothetical protein GLOIN_2v1557474 [Rhizophagus irregularis DAOM 181602=DAOM 197198]POG76377.1 hypothetical protein GLOIN_2v1557474 [Rhizophagus irregularis DAOM 181602=DAOM 197198]GBC19387.2 hypothetical protein GLOIN_2v1557474 [Rhizophagus irregularis DAOM 181602=DAOM 197198]|eukprot:XP_025183243.1 hypothetical protein GLOIN_2v1557474 [Rhizophagus irregularis DAOM 181602=DAOM 197198]